MVLVHIKVQSFSIKIIELQLLKKKNEIHEVWLSCSTHGIKFLAFETIHAQMIHEMKQNGVKSHD